jgi:hypothetical protein
VGERSFKQTSTASRLIFAHSLLPPPLLPPLRPPFARNNTSPLGHEPLPSIEGCGLIRYRRCSLRSEDAAKSPLPFPKGCGRLGLAQGKKGGRQTRKGTREVGGTAGTSQKRATTNVVARFSLITFSPNPQPTPSGTTRRQRPPPTSSLPQ